jgi:hypothetical protein
MYYNAGALINPRAAVFASGIGAIVPARGEMEYDAT